MQALRAADQERRPLWRQLLPLAQPCRELAGASLTATPVEGDQPKAGDARLDRRSLALQDLRACALGERLVPELMNLQPERAAEARLIIVRRRGERLADPPDDDDSEDL